MSSGFYAVKEGKIPGIYKTWAECQSQVNKFSGAKFQKFKTKAEAEDFMGVMTIDNDVNIPHLILPNIDHIQDQISSLKLEKKPKIETKTESAVNEQQKNQVLKDDCIYVDGGHNKMTKDVAWGCVTNSDGRCILADYKDLFTDMELTEQILCGANRICIISKFDDVKTQNNNGAELLSFVVALRIAIKHGKHKVIYSDSDLIVKYWSIKLKDDKRTKFSARKIKYIDEAILLRKQFEKLGGKIVKISGDTNPSDLGYHK